MSIKLNFFLTYSVFIVGFGSWILIAVFEYYKKVDNCKGLRYNALMERYIKVEKMKRKGVRL